MKGSSVAPSYHVEPRYVELVMAIGNHLELGPMLDECLPLYLKAIGGHAAALISWADPHSTPAPQVLHFYPADAADANEFRAAVGHLRDTLRHEGSHRVDAFPIIGQTTSGSTYNVFELSEVGWLLVFGSGAPMDPMAAIQLAPIHQKLSRACAACMQVRRVDQLNEDLVAQVQERKYAELQLHTQKAHLDQLFAKAQMGIVMASTDGRVIRINQEFTRLFGYEPAEAIGRSVDDLVAPVELRDEAESITYRAAQGRPVAVERQRRARNGNTLWVSIMAAPVVVAGDLVGVYAMYQDLTDRKEAEEALRYREEWYRRHFENASDIIFTLNSKLVFEDVSPSVFENLGWSPDQWIGQNIASAGCVSPKEIERLVADCHALLSSRRLPPTAYQMCTAAGRTRAFELSGSPLVEDDRVVGATIAARDIDDRLNMEAALSRAQKLEATGQMAGGIAHDFNNLLSIIMGNIDLVLHDDGIPNSQMEPLEDAMKACRLAGDLTQKFITFATGGDPVKEVISAMTVFQEAVDLSLSGTSVSAVFENPDDLWPIEADGRQMRYVIHDIIRNAVEAMPDGGKVRISTVNQSDADGNWVMTAIADSGVGIPPDQLPLVFDPYFTTKEMGSQKGMGMGLTVADSVIRKHGGELHIDSKPGRGTTVRIRLPASPTADIPAQPERPKQPIPISGQHVLIMDDEAMIRELTQEMIQRLGHTVVATANGEAAIAEYQAAYSDGTPFSIVVLDLTVKGGMGGLATLEALRAIDPSVRAVVCSGYGQNPIVAEYEEHGFAAALPKPYTLEQLNAVLAVPA